MHIQESTVQLTASHDATRQTLLTHEMACEFRNVFNDVADTQAGERARSQQQRVQQLLQSLVEAIMAAIDGRACEENFAAEDIVPPESRASGGREMAWQRTVSQSLAETERTTVCGKGCVRTGDGRQIDFDYSLALAREFRQTSSSTERGTTVLRDPLVLSFDGKSCELTADRIDFDLNADGQAEQIPGLAKGSCFLVLDRNGNGQADNGSELFGVASGNGFADLAALDGDANGWIDEGDAAFSRLALWSGDTFVSLKEAGVGALYTNAVDAPFSLKTASNELLGQIREAGLYLSESGKVGHLQQVDLAVSASSTGEQQPEEGEQLGAREQQEGRPESGRT